MMKHKLAFTILCILITACANQTADNQMNAPQATNSPANHSSLVAHFPQQANTPNAYLAALIGGELVLANGCLRVGTADGNSSLLVWDPSFSIREDQGVVQIINGAGEVVASVGDLVIIGGGFVPKPTYMELTEPLPEDCPGPYWLVGDSIIKVETSLGAHFPQLLIFHYQGPSAQTVLMGELVLENECLRMKVVDKDSFLLIWNLNFSTRTERDDVRVVDNQTGQILASTGDFVEITGREIDIPIGWGGLVAPIPNECPGPYFLVGESIKKIDKP